MVYDCESLKYKDRKVILGNDVLGNGENECLLG